MSDDELASHAKVCLARNHLLRAVQAANRRHEACGVLRSWWHGDDVEESWRNIHYAESMLFEAAGDDEFRGRLPRIHSYVSRHLGADPEWAESVAALASIVQRYAPPDAVAFCGGRRAYSRCRKRSAKVDDQVRMFVVTLLRAAQRVDDDEHTRLREYRNVLWVAFMCTTLLALLILFAARLFPEAVPVFLHEQCGKVEPEKKDHVVACAEWKNFPDVGMIMLYGLLGASVSILTTLPSLPAYEAPYSLRDPQLLLKASFGTLTAFIGVLVLESGTFDWVESLQPSGIVAVAAILFGGAQQFITRLVDKEAEKIITAAGAPVVDSLPAPRSAAVRSL